MDPFHHIEQYGDEGWLRPGDVSFDCGAHAGQMSTLFAFYGGKDKKTFAFDPFPQNYLQVEAQGRLNGLDNLMSERAGVGPMNAILNLSILSQQTVETAHSATMKDRIEMKIVPLDDYIDARPTFIKFDVEGAEVGALHGAQKLLARHRPRIFTELHTQFIGDFGHTPKDFFDAIPRSLYRTYYKVGGVDLEWLEYGDGDHVRVTAPSLVFSVPR
jgi:FkbM family methyltransferase